MALTVAIGAFASRCCGSGASAGSSSRVAAQATANETTKQKDNLVKILSNGRPGGERETPRPSWRGPC
jgi:hypothetical protein